MSAIYLSKEEIRGLRIKDVAFSKGTGTIYGLIIVALKNYS